jgi:AraC-like DNA-binding protein
MVRLDCRVSSIRRVSAPGAPGRFPHGAPVLTRHAIPTPVPDDAVADLVTRFAADHGISVPAGTGERDRLADAWTAMSSAGVSHPGLAFAAWATGALLGGVVPAIVANSPNLAALLERLQRFHPLFGTQQFKLVSSRHSTTVWLEEADGAPAHPDTIDACFAMLCSLTRQLTSNPVTPSRVVLRRPPPPDPDSYSELLGDVRFGADHDACTFDANSLSVPFENADPAVLSALEPYAERRVTERGQAFSGPVASLVAAQLDDVPSLASVGRALAISPRGLQLRLAQEKTSFSAIVDRVQRDRALALLVTSDLPIATIATDVGFSAPATLTRAVHRWTGLSPTEYRRRCQP